MFSLKLGLGVAAIGLTGGYFVCKSLRSRFTSDVSDKIPFDYTKNAIKKSSPDFNQLNLNSITAPEKPKLPQQIAILSRTTLGLAASIGKMVVINGAIALTVAAKTFTTAVAPKEKDVSILTPRWLISRNDDLIYMIGGVGASLALIFATFKLKLKPIMLFWLWALVLDGPHIWGTATRTYLDKQEWNSRRNLLLGSLAWFGIGTAFSSINISLFRSFAYTWAYYHLVKQHYGFMVLYKKKNNDLAELDNKIDKAMVWVGFSYPFITAMFRPGAPDIFKTAQKIVPAKFHPLIRTLTLGAFVSTLGAYFLRQVYKLKASMVFDTPKHLLLTASIGLHILVMSLPYGQIVDGFLLTIATLTAYHNVQYQRLMWFHNRNKYGKGSLETALKTNGLAAYFGRNFWFYLGTGLLFTLFYRPVLLRKARSGKYAHSLEGFFWGFAFLHYYLDSKIWHVRRDTKLNMALKMNSASDQKIVAAAG